MKLLKAILMCKFNLDEEETDRLLSKSRKDKTLGKWYGIAKIKLEQEYDKNKEE